jgi:hypothetical protein
MASKGSSSKANQAGIGGTAGDHHSPSTIAGQTGAGTTESRMGSAEAAVKDERSKAHTRSESASPKRKSRVKAPAAGGVKGAKSKGEKKAESVERKLRDTQQELNDLKAELGSVLGHPFGQIRPEEPGVQEPIGT